MAIRSDHVLTNKYYIGQYVEWQPPTGGRSQNVRITLCLPGNEYFTNIKKTIREEDILGRNL